LETIGDFIFREVKCEKCELYREWLELEIKEKEYFKNLLLNPNPGSERSEETPEWPSFNRGTSLSAIRRQLEADSVKRSKPAEDSELTEAERRFEESLRNAEIET
jgi:hypothetical protein